MITHLSDPVIVALVSGPVLVIVTWFVSRRRNAAEAERALREADKAAHQGGATLVEATLKWAFGLRDEIGALKQEIDSVKTQLAFMERENKLLRRHNELLSSQVLSLGGVPVAMPEEE
jgi:hypothetical protein